MVSLVAEKFGTVIRLMIGLLIVACIAPFFIKGPDGEPVMTLDDWRVELPEAMTSWFDQPSTSSGVTGESAAASKIYKWQDEDGSWHFGNAPPEAVVAEALQLGEVNLMPAYEPPPAARQAQTQTAAPAAPIGAVTATPGQIKEMMNTVNNLQQTIDSRKTEMDALTESAN